MLLEEVCSLRTTSHTWITGRLLSPAGRDTKKTVASGMLIRCAEDAVCRATSEIKAITSHLLQDAPERDHRFAERVQRLGGKGSGFSGETRCVGEGSLRISDQCKI